MPHRIGSTPQEVADKLIELAEGIRTGRTAWLVLTYRIDQNEGRVLPSGIFALGPNVEAAFLRLVRPDVDEAEVAKGVGETNQVIQDRVRALSSG